MDKVASPASRDPAPDLELPAADGWPLSLTELRGRAVVVSFLSHAA